MSVRTVEITECLYQLAQEKAAEEGQTLRQVIETYLRAWVGLESEGKETVTFIREEIYVVRPGDTLAKIATHMYGDAQQYVVIAEHNGITDPRTLEVAQELRIPFVVVIPASQHAAGRLFRFPLDETETDYYKFGSLYVSGSRWAGKPHPGVDFHQALGADVYAVGDGVVVVNRNDPTGYGHYLMIEHTLTTGQTVFTLYGHLQPDNETFVTPPVGTVIKGGNVVIGKEGETGYAGVPHVHFEVKKTAELGLYSLLNTYNLCDYFYDPYTFIRNENNRHVPVQ